MLSSRSTSPLNGCQRSLQVQRNQKAVLGDTVDVSFLARRPLGTVRLALVLPASLHLIFNLKIVMPSVE